MNGFDAEMDDAEIFGVAGFDAEIGGKERRSGGNIVNLEPEPCGPNRSRTGARECLLLL